MEGETKKDCKPSFIQSHQLLLLHFQVRQLTKPFLAEVKVHVRHIGCAQSNIVDEELGNISVQSRRTSSVQVEHVISGWTGYSESSCAGCRRHSVQVNA